MFKVNNKDVKEVNNKEVNNKEVNNKEVNNKDANGVVLVSLLLTLNIFHTLF